MSIPPVPVVFAWLCLVGASAPWQSLEAGGGLWSASVEGSLESAKQAGLPVVLHFSLPSCPPCRKMEGEVLQNPDVRNRLGQRFFGVKIDVEQSPAVAARYGVQQVPTQIWLNSAGTVIESVVGQQDLSAFMGRLERHSPVVTAKRATSDKVTVAFRAERPVTEVTLGLRGFSPVALVQRESWTPGLESLTADHAGVRYRFADEAEQQLFLADPMRYVPQFNGNDPVSLLGLGRTEAGTLDFGVVHLGRLYFFHSDEHRRKFIAAPRAYLAR